MSVIESNVYGLWVAAQTAKGTPITTAAKKLVQTAGGVEVNRDDAEQNYSDGDRFGDSFEWVNTLLGGGSPVVMATPKELSYLLWLFFGGETTTGTGPYQHVFKPGASGGKWLGLWQSIGLSTVVRRKFNDCRISSLRIEGSTANKLLRVTPTITSIDPGVVLAADPAVAYAKGTSGAASDNLPWIYTEGKGRFKVNTVVMSGHMQFALVIEDALTPVYGDDGVPYEYVPGAAKVRLEGCSVMLDSVGLARYNESMYGTAAPAADAKPLSSLAGVPTGSWEVDFQRNGAGSSALQRLKIEVPSIRWAPSSPLQPNPDGGVLELPLAGTARKSGSDLVTITANSDEVAHT